eukprot:2973303-Pyramimonas_sp.AAC.1
MDTIVADMEASKPIASAGDDAAANESPPRGPGDADAEGREATEATEAVAGATVSSPSSKHQSTDVVDSSEHQSTDVVDIGRRGSGGDDTSGPTGSSGCGGGVEGDQGTPSKGWEILLDEEGLVQLQAVVGREYVLAQQLVRGKYISLLK